MSSEAESPEPAISASAEPAKTKKSGVDPRGRSRALVALVGLCALAVVVGGAFGGMAWRGHATTEARRAALDQGKEAAGILLSYDFRDLDRTLDRRVSLLTGDFRDHYRDMVERTVAPAATSKQVTTTANVVASAVVDGTPDRVTLLLFVNQSSATPTLPEPVQTGSRIEMTLEQHDGRWLTSELKPV